MEFIREENRVTIRNNVCILNARIAVISDIHGNLEALIEVLNDIKKNNVDLIICLGDIIGKGINSKKCLDLIRKECDVVLKGNVDDRFCDNPLKFSDNVNEFNRIKFYQKELSVSDIKYINNLPLYTEFYCSGNLIRLFHAFINDPYKTINNYDLDFTKKFDLFREKENSMENVCDSVIFGHIHYQFMEKIYGKTLINCGSVGCSGCPILENGYDSIEEISNAHYLIIEGDLFSKKYSNINYIFKSVRYNKEKEIEASNLGGNIESNYELLLKTGYYPALPYVIEKIEDNGYLTFKKKMK